MAHARRAPTTVLGCSPMTFFLVILCGTAALAIFKSYLPGPYIIAKFISDEPVNPPPLVEEESDDPWDAAPIDELRDIPPQLPVWMFGAGGVPKFYTQTLFIMQYNSRRFERMHQWRNRLHYNEHVVNTVSYADDQHWPADDPGVYHCGVPAEGGMMAYECVANLMEDERFYAADQPLGYLFFHFDIIMRWSHWAAFNTSQFHAPRIDQQHAWNNGQKNPHDDWYWWPGKWGVPSLVRLYDNDAWKSYLPTSRYIKQGIGREFKWMARGFADVYWVPTALSEEFRIQSHIFRKNEIFTEVAAPMQCLLYGPDLCAPAAGIPFPGTPVCDIQSQPKLSWIHRADWTKKEELAWWDSWYLQPYNWIPANPPGDSDPRPPYEQVRPCYTKYENMKTIAPPR